eukprot:scaffold253215_cov17-Prasinocladus_malaysianus.AAC.2
MDILTKNHGCSAKTQSVRRLTVVHRRASGWDGLRRSLLNEVLRCTISSAIFAEKLDERGLEPRTFGYLHGHGS